VTLFHRQTESDMRLMRDQLIEAGVEALSDLDCETSRRDAYLEGLTICRSLDSLEDLEIVLSMRRGECRRRRRFRHRDDYKRYFWTTEAIAWVVTCLGEATASFHDGRMILHPGASIRRMIVSGIRSAAFKAAALLLAAMIAGIAGAALTSAFFG